MTRIAVITGVASEAEVLAQMGNVRVGLSGARPDGARRAIAELLKDKPDGLVSFGTAGGLAPDCGPGTLLVADAIVAPDGERHAVDERWSVAIAAALAVERCTVAGSESVLTAVDKGALRKRTGADAVDMESHIALEMAAAQGIPFAVLRAVIDPVSRDIPAWISATVREDGTTDLARVLCGALTHPKDIPSLMALGGDHRKAIVALRRAVGITGPALCFRTR